MPPGARCGRYSGPVTTQTSLQRAARLNVSGKELLQRNDSYGFFSPLGDLVVTGPTRTNVNDYRAILVA